VRGDWLIEAATRAPLFDRLQKLGVQERRAPPFDLTDSSDALVRTVQLYQANKVDARVAAAELGLAKVEELDARWPQDKADLRRALDENLPRSRWGGEEGPVLFVSYVCLLKLGIPRARHIVH
jgi:hypothetical protein